MINQTETDMDEFDEEAADFWNDGALDGYRGKPQSIQDPAYLEGWHHGRDQRRVRVVTPIRPEGYYHSRLD